MSQEKTHSRNFDRVKRWFDSGFWNTDMVKNAVGRWITKKEYEEITGEPYDAGD